MNTPLLQKSETHLDTVLELAKGCSDNSSTIRTVVMKALSDLYVGFDQVKTALNIPEEDSLAKTLDLFSYGLYEDYKRAAPGTYLQLNDAQIFRLKQLTLVTMVQKATCAAQTTLSYADLSQTLDTDAQSLEEIIISSVYARLINGQLCQKLKTFQFAHGQPCIARDVHPKDLPQLLQTIQILAKRLDATMQSLDLKKQQVDSCKSAHETFWKQVEGNVKPRSSKRSRPDIAMFVGKGQPIL